MDVSMSAGTDPVTEQVHKRGLMPLYNKLFDEEGLPRDLPMTSAHILREGGMKESTIAWIDRIPRAKLLDTCLKREYIGKPRIPITKQQGLEEDFMLFPDEASLPPPPPPPPPSTTGQGTMLKLRVGGAPSSSSSAAAVGAGGGGASSSSTTTTTQQTETSSSTAASVVSSTPSLPSEAASVLRTEDALFALVSSSALKSGCKPMLTSRFIDEILLGTWGRLKALRWAEWPYGDGNPFVLKITKANAAANGVPLYFQFIKKPMDLTRVREKIKAYEYTGPDDFFADLSLIVYNAKLFNGPYRPEAVFPDPHANPPPIGLNMVQFGPKSIYGMAFDFEREVASIEPLVRACFEQLQRLVTRQFVMQMPLNNEQMNRYKSPEFQASLAAATQSWATWKGIKLVK